MEKKKQSSVEWLFVELWNTPKDKFDWQSIFEQAKAMHKEEIIETWYNCKMSVIEKNPTTADQYYEQTFGGQDNEII